MTMFGIELVVVHDEDNEADAINFFVLDRWRVRFQDIIDHIQDQGRVLSQSIAMSNWS